MKILSLILLSLFFVGCSSHKEMVNIDYEPSIPKLPPMPNLPIKKLNSNSEPDQVIKAYVASVVIQKSYIDEINVMIDSLI